jgi:hypothetical protein
MHPYRFALTVERAGTLGLRDLVAIEVMLQRITAPARLTRSFVCRRVCVHHRARDFFNAFHWTCCAAWFDDSAPRPTCSALRHQEQGRQRGRLYEQNDVVDGCTSSPRCVYSFLPVSGLCFKGTLCCSVPGAFNLVPDRV